MGYSYKRTKRSRKNKLRKNKRNSKKYGGSSKRYSRYMLRGGGVTGVMVDRVSKLDTNKTDMTDLAKVIVDLIYDKKNLDAPDDFSNIFDTLKTNFKLNSDSADGEGGDGGDGGAPPQVAIEHSTAEAPLQSSEVQTSADQEKMAIAKEKLIIGMQAMTLEKFKAEASASPTLSADEKNRVDGLQQVGFANAAADAELEAAEIIPTAQDTPFNMIFNHILVE